MNEKFLLNIIKIKFFIMLSNLVTKNNKMFLVYNQIKLIGCYLRFFF